MSKNNLINEWKRKKAPAKPETRLLLKKLKKKKGKQLDKHADEVHGNIFKNIDCLECANCCTSIPPIVNKTDASRIAKKLGMKPAAFEKEYLVIDEDGDIVMNTSPCPFLQKNNNCLIYEIRPKACRQFPHTDNLDFSKNMKLHGMNANICPGVFHILRRLGEVI
ncbi:MAG TPA: YkgJ family cysteine cluster protein [Bacteroidetes bacterium]|nr:YkgJ family cysteine cluster protein [Bacteroidota bacterium]